MSEVYGSTALRLLSVASVEGQTVGELIARVQRKLKPHGLTFEVCPSCAGRQLDRLVVHGVLRNTGRGYALTQRGEAELTRIWGRE